MSKLAPLMEKIKATDRLIDLIVYKLYGLTADEIKIVEGSAEAETTTSIDKDLVKQDNSLLSA